MVPRRRAAFLVPLSQAASFRLPRRAGNMRATRGRCRQVAGGQACMAEGARVTHELEGTNAYWGERLVAVNTVKGKWAWVMVIGEEIGPDQFMVEVSELRSA